MKGYVLYGYTRDGQDYYTLVTGTNRLKTFEELDGAEPITGDDGWVRVRVAGAERAKDLLGRLPEPVVMVESIRHVSVAQNTVPADVGEPDQDVLRELANVR